LIPDIQGEQLILHLLMAAVKKKKKKKKHEALPFDAARKDGTGPCTGMDSVS
jgi:hypothetical protein